MHYNSCDTVRVLSMGQSQTFPVEIQLLLQGEYFLPATEGIGTTKKNCS